MEEQIVIESVVNRNLKKIFKIIIIACIATALFCAFIGICVGASRRNNYLTRFSSTSKYSYIYSSYAPSVFSGGLAWFIINWTLLFYAGIAAIFYALIKKCKLTITRQNVHYYGLFGKELILPVGKISAYATRKLFSTIVVATTAGKCKSFFIENYKEIAQAIKELIG